jgi:transketolase N-terminal domain/subunit
MTALESEDRRDPNRARVVLSKGHEVVGPGYLRVTGVAGKVTDKRENLGYHDRVSQNSNTDQQADRVGRVSRVGQVTRFSPNSSTD